MHDHPQICVIDDDDAIRGSLCFLLQSAELKAAAFDSAQAFLNSSRAEPVGCIITDIQMPGMNGIELVRHMRTEGHTAPAIVMTGRGDVGSAIESMRAGAFDFVEKPFEDEQLLSAVRSALSQANGEESGRANRYVEQMQGLSEEERAIVLGLMREQSHQALANELDLSPHSVEILRARIMSKLGTSSLVELVRFAFIATRGW